MTGKSSFPVRDVYSKEVTLVPNFKLILIVNFEPELNVASPAIRRRVVMVPFNADFSDELGNVVEGLDEILLEEADGIFSDWLVPGLMAYNRDGLGTCKAVRDATRDYLKGANICADFVAECCTEERGALYAALQLREDINAWWDERNEPRRAKDDISLALKALGFQTDRRTVGGIKTTYYLGIRPKGLQI
jgi:putative DNA primase/helicase